MKPWLFFTLLLLLVVGTVALAWALAWALALIANVLCTPIIQYW
jgi:hypothetical protein